MFFKKKEVEPEIIPLSEKEIKDIKEALSKKEVNYNVTIKDLNIGELCPQAFNHGVINIVDGKHALFLRDSVNSDQYITFKKSKGGRFNKDVLNYLRDKPTGKYLLIEGKDDKKIVRLIDDEDILLYQTLKLINGIAKDKPYMLLKKLELNDPLFSTSRYIKEKTDDVIEDENVMSISPQVSVEEEESAHTTSSVSLFDE